MQFFSTVQAQRSTRLITGWQFLKQDLGSIWEAVRPAKPGDPETLPVWENVQLPHCVNAKDAVDPDVNYYQGPSWYRTQLKIANPYVNGRTLLHFEGAGQKTEVYIFTTKVGSHTGGYDEFTIDITDAVAAFQKTADYQQRFKGQIPLSIRTDNSRDAEMIPSSLSDFNLYGGIYRYLNLVYTPALSIDKIFATPVLSADRKSAELKLQLRAYSPTTIAAPVSVNYVVKDPGGKQIQRGEQKIISVKNDLEIGSMLIKAPTLWSPEQPLLYTVEVKLISGSDTAVQLEKIAFRSTEWITRGPFLLNGKRLLLRGTQRHEDHAGVGAAMTEDMMRKEMILMKDMGVNFIRLGHYQQSRIILQLCDSLGILVWEEIPWCRGGLGGEVYQQQGKRMLTNMIEQHYNHPSVIIWGLGNENDWPNDFPGFDKEKIRNYMKELNVLSHSLDPSRKTAIRRCDFCKDIPDIYSPSIWAGWYRGIYTEYKEATETEFEKTDHFLHAEWGGDSHAGRHSENPDRSLSQVKSGGGTDERAGDASLFGGAARASKDGDWSESYIVNLFDWHLKEQETMPKLTGAAQWVFKDFSTPIRPDNPVPYVNQKGLVERDLTPKESYYVFQSYWASKPMAHIYGHSWPVRWGSEGELRMVKVYSNCETAELFVNGKSVGTRKRNSQDFPAAGLRWNVPFVKGNNTIKVIARSGKIVVQDSISTIYQTEQWGKAAILKLEKIAVNDSTVTVQVLALDSKNILCLDARDYVYFSVAGDGSLFDDQGTAGGSRKVQLANGRATIKIKLQKGKAVAGVHTDQLPSVFLEL